jgi:hypothetical protein
MEEKIMRRKIMGLLIGVFLITLCLGLVPQRAWAYPPCGPFDRPLYTDGDPATSDSFCRPMYIGNELVQLAPGVPFAWIRAQPSSTAPVLTTIYPTSYPSMRIIYANAQYTVWDGFQNWYQVHPYPMNTSIVGWVEQASITFGYRSNYPPENPADLAQWSVPQTGYVKPGVPFLWLRSQPGSTAVLATLPAGATLTIVGSPTFDGVQWWWLVDYRARTGIKRGYVEQQLIIASNGPQY